MRIQLASDLHLEFLKDRFPRERIIEPAFGADLLVLAGDIANGIQGVQMFANWPVPVLYAIGNHEAYGFEFEALRHAVRRATRGTSVVLLDNDVADLRRFEHWAASRTEELMGIRILGCTLWTDYQLPGARLSGRRAMDHAENHIADHRAIHTTSGAPFSPRDARREHQASVAWLAQELGRPFDGKTVVITHHAPHVRSVHPRYAGDLLNPAFASHLPALVAQADLWLHGHVHDTFDYIDGRCRVVANPLGYPRNRDAAAHARDLIFENSAFRHALVVEV